MFKRFIAITQIEINSTERIAGMNNSFFVIYFFRQGKRLFAICKAGGKV